MLSICDTSHYRANYVRRHLTAHAQAIRHCRQHRRWIADAMHCQRTPQQFARQRSLSLTRAGADNISHFANDPRLGHDVAPVERKSTILRYHLDAVSFRDNGQCIECGKQPMPLIWMCSGVSSLPQNRIFVSDVVNHTAQHHYCTCRESACRFTLVSGLVCANYFVRSLFARDFARALFRKFLAMPYPRRSDDHVLFPFASCCLIRN